MLALIAACVSAARGDPKELEARRQTGKAKLEKDLALARKLGRPEWVAKMPVPIELNDNYRHLRREIDYRFHRNKNREGLRIVYALVDHGSDRMKRFARWYLPQSLIWAGEIPFAMVLLLDQGSAPRALNDLGQCYLAYDQYDEATACFEKALANAPAHQQKNLVIGRACYGMGDVCRRKGDYAQAKKDYRKARDAYQEETRASGKPGWYRNEQKKNMSRMTALETVCEAATLDIGGLKAGTYVGQAEGYSDTIKVQVKVGAGKIEQVKVIGERESIALDSLSEIPRRIVARQSPSVDAVTGATVTSCAIMGATTNALRKAK